MTIRRARLDDAPALARVHAASWREAYRGLLPDAYLDDLNPRRLAVNWRRQILRARRSPQGPLEGNWLVERAGGVVGFATTGPCQAKHLRGFAGELFMLYVDPAAQGRGGGGALFAHATEALAELGFRWLVVGVLEANVQARGFYAARGLQPDGGRWIDRFAGGEAVPVVRYAGPLRPVWPG
jgi:ribosomal protein S18 acetylase RimI-like enzyme